MTEKACASSDGRPRWVTANSTVCALPAPDQASCNPPSIWASCNGVNRTQCASQDPILQCNWNYRNTCPDQTSCLEAGGQCNDYEFGSSFKNGVCVYVPSIPYSCDSKDSNTQGKIVCFLCLRNQVVGVSKRTKRKTIAINQDKLGEPALQPPPNAQPYKHTATYLGLGKHL